MRLDLDHLHRVHCVGVGGIGVSAVAKLLRLLGKEVTGSDLSRTEIVDGAERVGVVFKEPSADNVAPDLDLLIYTSAAPETHPERVAAATLGIPQLSYFEFLGLLSSKYLTIAVCGTKGKSTTTAMLGLMLEAAGFDPLVIVGALVPEFPHGNLRMAQEPGKAHPVYKLPVFVVEACEHHANFLHLDPKAIVVTHIAEEHLDYYRDLEHIRQTFRTFVMKSRMKGGVCCLVFNGDDANAAAALGDIEGSRTFGFGRMRDWRAVDLNAMAGAQRFTLKLAGAAYEEWRDLVLHVPGAYNVLNALAAAAMAYQLGVDEASIRKTLEGFRGIWRRFERVGERGGAPVISDYAHTPDSLTALFKGAREFFPGRRLVVAFQPHQHDRTRRHFDAFASALSAADALTVAEIYGVAGRMHGAEAVSSRDLVEAIRKRAPGKDVRYAAGPDEARRHVEEMAGDDAMILVVGAGNLYLIARDLCTSTKRD